MLGSRASILDRDAFDRLMVGRLLWLVRGWESARALQAFAWVTDEYLLPTRREHVLERLRRHQADGHLVVIASGTFTPSLEVLGERLGVRELVGTGVEIKNGRYTGGFIPPIIKGQDKVAQLTRHLRDRQLVIDWKSSFAYADSYSDRELLGHVGHPVAVHPDAALRALATRSGWEVLENAPPKAETIHEPEHPL
jgi:HAD superfamily hydrolase (TIGR01490 family)